MHLPVFFAGKPLLFVFTCCVSCRRSILSRRIWASLSLSSNIRALFHWSIAFLSPSLSSSVSVSDRRPPSIFIPSTPDSTCCCRASNNMASSSKILCTVDRCEIQIRNTQTTCWLLRIYGGWIIEQQTRPTASTIMERIFFFNALNNISLCFWVTWTKLTT